MRDCIRSAKSKQDDKVRVLDPFAGSGTVLVEAEEENVPSYGVESHPFVSRVAQAKITSGIEAEAFRSFAAGILKRAQKVTPDVGGYPDLIRKCYPDDILEGLDRLRKAWVDTPRSPALGTRVACFGGHPEAVLPSRYGELAVYLTEQDQGQGRRAVRRV